MRETWPQQRKRHAMEQYQLVHWALRASGWSVGKAARQLRTSPSVLDRVVGRHADLRVLVAAHKRPRGRPKKTKG